MTSSALPCMDFSHLSKRNRVAIALVRPPPARAMTAGPDSAWPWLVPALGCGAVLILFNLFCCTRLRKYVFKASKVSGTPYPEGTLSHQPLWLYPTVGPMLHQSPTRTGQQESSGASSNFRSPSPRPHNLVSPDHSRPPVPGDDTGRSRSATTSPVRPTVLQTVGPGSESDIRPMGGQQPPRGRPSHVTTPGDLPTPTLPTYANAVVAQGPGLPPPYDSLFPDTR